MSTAGASSAEGPKKDCAPEPELYRLVAGARRGRDVDWTSVRERLEALGEVLLEGSDVEATNGTAARGTGARNIKKYGGGRLQEEVQAKKVEEAMCELGYSNPLTGVTALHVMCCYRPPPSIVGLYLRLASSSSDRRDRRSLKDHRRRCGEDNYCAEEEIPVVWKRSHNGSTALHFAAGNGAEVEVVRMLLDAAGCEGGWHEGVLAECLEGMEIDNDNDGGGESTIHNSGDDLSHVPKKRKNIAASTTIDEGPSSSHHRPSSCRDEYHPSFPFPSSSSSPRAHYALLRTRDRGYTALQSACAAVAPEASLPVIRLLSDAAPMAATLSDHELAQLGRTPLDVLCGNYELLVRRYVQSAEAELGGSSSSSSDNDEEEDNDGGEDDSILPWRNGVPNEPLRHFWSKASVLVRAAASVVANDDRSRSYSRFGCSFDDDERYRHLRRDAETTETTMREGGGDRDVVPIVHAALSLPPSFPCPPNLLRLVLLSFPRQLRTRDHSGDLPLHVACRNIDAASRPLTGRGSSFSRGGGTGRSSVYSDGGMYGYGCGVTALDALLSEHPEAARVASGRDGKVPIQILVPGEEEATVRWKVDADVVAEADVPPSPSPLRRRPSSHEVRRMIWAVRKVLYANPSGAASLSHLPLPLLPSVLKLLADPEVAEGALGVREGCVYPQVGRSLLGRDDGVSVGDVPPGGSGRVLLGNMFEVLRAKPELLLGFGA